MPDIKIELNKNPKAKVTDTSKLGFGKYFTDHMFIMDYSTEKGWYDPRIVPYGKIELDPASMVLHYGQEVFEGMKAFKTQDGRVLLFRPQENFKRLNNSNTRLAIPQIDEAFALEALKKLVAIDKDWVPQGIGPALYIRPFIFASQPNLGVKISNQYMFMIIMSPVGSYFKAALTPTNILVEDEYVRAVRGGTGEAKTGGNYACALKAQDKATAKECGQVLWLDAIEHKYIEEVGAMNVFFVIGDEVITPALNGSILHGITRKSVIELLKKEGYKVSERRISIDEIYEASQNNTLKEVFGSGTAAVISPVGVLKWKDKVITVNNNTTGPVAEFIYNKLLGLQTGSSKDELGWTVEVK